MKNCRTDAWDGNGKMQVKVKPSSRGIACRQVDARTVEFTLHRPEFLSVEFNGERKQNLHIFANDMLAETYTGKNQMRLIGKERTHKTCLNRMRD